MTPMNSFNEDVSNIKYNFDICGYIAYYNYYGSWNLEGSSFICHAAIANCGTLIIKSSCLPPVV
jgi:hypothetical protein